MNAAHFSGKLLELLGVSTGALCGWLGDALPKPKIEEVGMRLRFTVYLAKPHEINTTEPSGLESGLESKTAGNILCALSEHPLNRSEIALSLGHQRISGAVNRTVKELLQKEFIEYTIPEKPNSRLQQYRLTDKGRAALSKTICLCADHFAQWRHASKEEVCDLRDWIIDALQAIVLGYQTPRCYNDQFLAIGKQYSINVLKISWGSDDAYFRPPQPVGNIK